MFSNPASRLTHKHANGWMTILAVGMLVLGLLACLYMLVGFPAEAQVTGSTIDPPSAVTQAQAPAPSGGSATAGSADQPAPLPRVYRRRVLQGYAAQGTAGPNGVQSYPSEPSGPLMRRRYITTYAPVPVAPEAPSPQATAAAARTEVLATQFEGELKNVRDQFAQSQEALRQADQSQRKTRIASAVFLIVFAIIAALIVVQVYVQARGWDRESTRAGEELAAMRSELEAMRAVGGEGRSALPALLQDIGEQPLAYQEEGSPFAPRAMAMIQDIDHMAYVGQGRMAFRDLASPSEAAVYLNGLLLSAVAHLSRSDPWTTFSRLDQFFLHLSHFPGAVERLRIAQGYSYRAMAAYQVLISQDREPSWRRKADRAQLESLLKQAFEDVAHANSVDPEWKHATFVEALLCSRFYLAEEAVDNSSRNELLVRGLRRSVSLYKGLIDERFYRGPSRRNLIRSLKQIAEFTGEKGDFSEFGFALNAFPADDELADETLAARHPNSQDRYLWQWMLGDEELFANVDRLNQSEYRAFWIRMLDNKVRLRNWRADLAELQQANPAMKDWKIQLLQIETPIALSHAVHRRLERYDSASASGA